ncbi:hypothetical protein ACFX1Z_013379 [Malus domestica]
MGQFSREQGKLPSSMDVNPKGGFKFAKAITLRSEKKVVFDPSPSKSNQKEDEKMQSEEKNKAWPSQGLSNLCRNHLHTLIRPPKLSWVQIP